MSTNASLPAMPAKGHPTAPTFDPNDPFAFHGYFLELETLFKRCGVVDDTEKKQWAVRYLQYLTADLWRTLPEYSDETKSYEDFKKALRTLYPGSDDNHKYSMADLDKVVQHHQSVGMANTYDLAAYYRDFFAILEYLKKQKWMASLEQDRKFREGFPPRIWMHVENRLLLKNPDHPRGVPWTVNEIYEAALWVLDGPTPGTTFHSISTANTVGPAASPSVPQSNPPAQPQMKAEDLLPVIERLIHTFEGVAASAAGRGPPPMSGFRPPPPRSLWRPDERDSPTCLYCGEIGCRIRNCKHVEEDMAKGYCHRSPEGRIVAFDGRYLQRVGEQTIRDAILEYAKKNGLIRTPGQPQATDAQDHPPAGMMLYEAVEEPVGYNETRAVNLGERIEELDSKILRLESLYANAQAATGQKTAFDGVVIESRPQRSTARPGNPGNSRTRSPARNTDRRVRFEEGGDQQEGSNRPPTPEPSQKGDSSANRDQNTPVRNDRQTAGQEPIHPYARAKDATYAPPAARNFATPAKYQTRGGSYTNLAPVVQREIADDIFRRSMKSASIPMTVEEILSISPDVRNRYREAVTPKRIVENAQPNPTSTGVYEEAVTETMQLTVDCHGEALETGAMVVPDIYDSLYNSAPPEDGFLVASESHALRTVPMKIDRTEEVDCILDPGSQVICMSGALCHRLNLMYDPKVTLTMQSANGGYDRSLGLVRNVPCTIGPITLYLQIHVIERASYDVLLGRPFDVLTESVVQNYSDERQTITIVCPNTGQHISIPTKARVRPRPESRQGFPNGLRQRSST